MILVFETNDRDVARIACGTNSCDSVLVWNMLIDMVTFGETIPTVEEPV